MRNLLAKRVFGQDMPRIRLNAIWYVEADHTYDVEKREGTAGSQYVAIRTIAGAGNLTLGRGEIFRLTGGSLGLFPACGIRHYATQTEKWQFYWFEFDMDGEDMDRRFGRMDILISAQEQAELEKCFACLHRGAPEESMLAEALFGYLLADWRLRTDRNSETDWLHGRIPELLEKGRREKMSVSEMAREIGMCERSFRDAVHAVTGLSPKRYMLKGEMEAAMELLHTTDMSISEIAACFQYASPFYFSRVFKNYHGLSPQAAREKAAKSQNQTG